MDNIRQYIFTSICMSILCGLVTELFANNAAYQKLLKFAAGMLMTVVAITPLTGKNIWQSDFLSANLHREAQHTLAAGQEQADGMLRQIITERTQAYILDKAVSMGAELSAEVFLTDTTPPTPEAIILDGEASPYVKKRLTAMLVSDLAISEDKLQWN